MTAIAIIAVLAYVMDALLGEPRRFHPIVGMGNWAQLVAQRLHPGSQAGPVLQFLLGVLAWSIAMGVPVMVLAIVFTLSPAWLDMLFALLVLYVCIAPKSLVQHAEAVSQALAQDNLDAARSACGMMVSRDTQAMTREEVCTATIESVLENAHDAVIAPVFWFAVGGWWGALIFRLSNTLDAMWGYRNARYLHFGRCAARCDDVLGYLSARLTVLLFALRQRRALTAALEQGDNWDSPNAGPVMAAGAGALGVRLGGAARYGGERKLRPVLGSGRAPRPADIDAALKLVRDAYRMLLLGLVVLAVLV